MTDAAGNALIAKSAPWRTLIPSWPLMVAIATFLKAIADRAALLNDADTYLHIAAGRWMLIHHVLPASDPFSNSMPGAPWVVHEWLSEIALALAYGGFGWSGIVLLTAGAFALTLALLTRWLLVRMEPIAALILVALSAAMLEPHLLARPHWLAAPALLAWSAAVVAARDRSRAPPFALLPLMTVWANLHGGFITGIAVALFFGAEAVVEAPPPRRLAVARAWGGFTALAVLAAAVTPNGLGGLALPLRLVGMSAVAAHIGEWQALDFAEFQTFELWLLLLIGSGFSLGLKLPLSRLLLIVLLTHLGLTHSRHVDLAALLGPLAVAAPLGPQLAAHFAADPDSPLRRWFRDRALPAGWPARGATFAVLLAIAALCFARPIIREDHVETPASAVAAAQQMQLRGPVFNSYAFGGFLIFRGIAPFIDGRAEVYGDDFLGQFSAAIAGNERVLEGIIEHYAIGWTLLSPGDGATRVLDGMPGWRRVYADDWAVIHVRAAAPASWAPTGGGGCRATQHN
ncbi:MAG TPA: hypothetical protein VGU20_00825 [Stellaceae bacterium]|nr:hypothetical protein [Stellaceae bacterium]